MCFSGRESDFRRVLWEEGREILILALSSLEAAVVGLKDGSIEFQLLNVILDHSEQFFVVYEEICKDESEKSMLKQLLDQRSRELTEFEIERQKVFSFIRMCLTIKQGNATLHVKAASPTCPMFQYTNLSRHVNITFKLPKSNSICKFAFPAYKISS